MSCVVKLLERILADRLYYIAESNHLSNCFQAGFWNGRSCEDQILRVVQAIKDDFQKKPMDCSVVLALLSFRKACDTVWREKLLQHKLNMGVLATIIHWLRSFLNDRRASVHLFNVLSSRRWFLQDLSKDSVLAPLLFLFYINNLVNRLSNKAVIEMFAGDNSILATARNKVYTDHLAEAEVEVVLQWSQQWKIELNVEKSQVFAFFTWSNESKWKPTIKL